MSGSDPLSPLRFRKMPEPLFRRYVFVAPSDWIRFYDVASFDLRRVPNSDIIRTDQKKAKGFERLYRHTIFEIKCSFRVMEMNPRTLFELSFLDLPPML